jgi:hypothetical protein
VFLQGASRLGPAAEDAATVASLREPSPAGTCSVARTPRQGAHAIVGFACLAWAAAAARRSLRKTPPGPIAWSSSSSSHSGAPWLASRLAWIQRFTTRTSPKRSNGTTASPSSTASQLRVRLLSDGPAGLDRLDPAAEVRRRTSSHAPNLAGRAGRRRRTPPGGSAQSSVASPQC